MNYQTNCKICKRHGNCDSEKEMEKSYPVHIVIGCSACEPKPMTNADRIRSMTDEELAEWFIKIQDDVADYYDGGHAFAPELPTMENSWLDWLKQEASE